MKILSKIKLSIGTLFFPELARAVAAHEALKELVFARDDGDGVVRRIDKNRELLEILLRDSPEVLQKNLCVMETIKLNDVFLVRCADIISEGRGGGYLARPMPNMSQV
jgi:hypothetical protein